MAAKRSRKADEAAALTHLNEAGEARMVDVGDKEPTRRTAVARGEVRLGAEAWKALTGGSPKGDVLAVARIAGIQAAKKTSELIPLCHPLPITKVRVDLKPVARARVVRIEAEVRCDGKTGVEMEAMTAVSVAALAVYDMLKAADKGIEIGPIRLARKSGGKSGDWKSPKTG